MEEIKKSDLFTGIDKSDLESLLKCIGSYIKSYKKGEYISCEDEKIKNIGVVLCGGVHMIKEDIWGNKTILTLIDEGKLFGETFACGSNSFSAVTFCASCNAKVLFLPFERVMHTCSTSCVFHHRIIENMVRMIADKNKSLMEKVEVISKKTLREKILVYLSLCAQNCGKNQFKIKLGRVEMAEYLCVNRSALTRELSKMKDEGIINYEKNIFYLLKE